MVNKKTWKSVRPEVLTQLAQNWMLEIRGDPAVADQDIGLQVTMMNFMAPPDQQWLFILSAIDLAKNADELGPIAAGPIEHLLGWHGDAWIEQAERQAQICPKFARALTGVWQYLMSDEVWARVQAIQWRVPDPLPAYRGAS